MQSGFSQRIFSGIKPNLYRLDFLRSQSPVRSHSARKETLAPILSWIAAVNRDFAKRYLLNNIVSWCIHTHNLGGVILKNRFSYISLLNSRDPFFTPVSPFSSTGKETWDIKDSAKEYIKGPQSRCFELFWPRTKYLKEKKYLEGKLKIIVY